ncbi:MAG: hypothetical protein AAF645_15980, partial [Myxococcota bacterium]
RPVVTGGSERVEDVAGVPVAYRLQPGTGWARIQRVSFLGARTADEPAALTMAAWSFESAQVRALVGPEKTVLESECAPRAPGGCTAALIGAGAGDFGPREHAALAARLENARLQSRGSEARAATLALSAAWDQEIDPFAGEAIPSVQAVRRMRRALRRAAVVVEGDVAREAAEGAASELAEALEAPDLRAPANASGERRVRRESGTRSRMALAFDFADPSRARWFAEGAAFEGETNLFRTRDGAVALVQLRAVDHRALRRLARLASGGGGQRSWPSTEIDELARARQQRPALRMGVGLVCASDEECAEDAPAGWNGDEHASGARIALRAGAGEISLVALFASGASRDRVRGAHAVAAEAMALTCGGEPVVEGMRFGLRARFPAGDTAGAVALIDCVAQRRWMGAPWRDAQRRVIARQRPERAWVGEVLTPGAAGWTSPRGTALGAASAEAGPWLEASMSGLRMGAIGAFDADTLRAAARDLVIDGAQAGTSAVPDASAEHLVPRDQEQAVVVALCRGAAAPGNVAAAAVGRAFARAQGEHLRAAGLEVLWAEGGAAAAIPYAAVALSGEATERLAGLLGWTPPDGEGGHPTPLESARALAEGESPTAAAFQAAGLWIVVGAPQPERAFERFTRPRPAPR